MKISAIVMLSFLVPVLASSQVRIRIFADRQPHTAFFTVTSGQYRLNTYPGAQWILKEGDLAAITQYSGRLAVKVMNDQGFYCDSVSISGSTGKDMFSVRILPDLTGKRNYSGDISARIEFGTLLLVNTEDIESYIAGVVKSEGGSGKYPEYFKTQAVIARTYLYRNVSKHASDHFNLCDNTHCQVFEGVTSDTLIQNATLATRGEIIMGPDSMPVIAAFHSNCGGETARSEDVWLSPQPYLVRVKDPWCLESRNAKWTKSVSLADWSAYLKKAGFSGTASLLNFSQITRTRDYRAGGISVPLLQIRNDFNLRSTFFSVAVKGDSVLFSGRGYGHGVGLCQEGAMTMASRGYDYHQIIGFYYTGVKIIRLSD
ncbi:MAG: SpoIID/LytB domain-containing protein [Bacteroidales bacterium]|nr:SpoIID/LytB domain-containing protein [Bacteroidales bacterium]